MKTLYFGSDEFSQKILEGILKENLLEIVTVISVPDKPQKRGLKILPTPVKKFAQENNLEVLTSSLLDEEFYKKLGSRNIDLALVVGYGRKIPSFFLNLTKLFLGIHPSLLPRYRGSAPIERVLLEGERETGVTIFKITEKIDAGPIILQKKVKIDLKDDYFTLFSKLTFSALEGLKEVISLMKKNKIRFFPQKGEISYASKIKKEEAEINWSLSAEKIYNMIRAFKKWPVAYTFYRDKRIKILEAEVVNDKDLTSSPSQIINWDKEGIEVATGKGIIKIKKLQPEGKKIMDGVSFVCGYRVKKGDKFEKGG